MLKKFIIPASFLLLTLSIVAPNILSSSLLGTFDPLPPGSVSIELPYPTTWQEIDNDTMQVHVSNEFGEDMNVSFYWLNHTRISYVDPVTNDTDAITHSNTLYTNYQRYDWYVNVTSNSCSTHSTTFTFYGEAYFWDVDRNGLVDIEDVALINVTYLSDGTLGRCDVNQDGIVNYLDTGLLAMHYGDDYT